VPRARIADIAIGAKVRVSKNVIAKNVIEPLKRAIAAREKRGSGSRVLIACRRPGAATHSISGTPTTTSRPYRWRSR
jgi:predicted amidohydrolase